MTNPTTESLLPRFAACADRLKGTGAPGLPDTIKFAHGKWWIVDATPGLQNYVANDPAVLSCFVLWAMEVDLWLWEEHEITNHIHHHEFSDIGEYALNLLDMCLQALDLGTLESICDAIGETK